MFTGRVFGAPKSSTEIPVSEKSNAMPVVPLRKITPVKLKLDIVIPVTFVSTETPVVATS